MAKEFKLLITFNGETKDCRVTGPVNEPDLCLLGLELARRVIEQSRKTKIVSAPAGAIARPAPMPLDFRKMLRNLGS
jgi:hypothetical protein